MITIYTFTYNEEYILPHFVKWYKSRFPECHIVVSDNNSTDNTKNIALSLGCEVVEYLSDGKYSDSALVYAKNNIWRESLTDWVLVCDADEFMDIYPKDLNDNQTIFQGIGYNMVNVNNISEVCLVRHGIKAAQYDKMLCFNKKHITDINYNIGCHTASPVGNIIFASKRPYILHMKFMDINILLKKYKLYSSRLSEENIQHGWSNHYDRDENILREEFMSCIKISQEINLEKKDHLYQHIDGWFNMEDQYLELLAATPEDGLFVEIGAYKGRSTCFIATEIHNQKRNLRYVVVDSFEGATGSQEPFELHVYKDVTFNELYSEYCKNIDPINNYITTEVGISHEVANRFLDNSIDTLFIDGGHSYNQVKADLDAWLPKLKTTGIISGHDYNSHAWPGVVAAVNEKFGSPHKIENQCWFIYLKDYFKV